MTKESPIFTRVHDLLLWLLPATRKFPRDQRLALAEPLRACAYALQEELTAAALDTARTSEHLVAADIALNLLRKRLLLCHELQLFSAAQYRHVSGLTKEVGALLGSWRSKAG